MNGHAKMGLTTYSELVSKGTGRPLRRSPTARVICICRWVGIRHASTYSVAERLAEIALEHHVRGFDNAEPSLGDLEKLAEITKLSIVRTAIDVESEEL